jgi:hypothetical protein
VFAAGAADLSVYREYGFVARLQQDQLLTRQSDVFSRGPVRRRLLPGIKRYLRAISRQLLLMGTPDYLEEWELQDSAEIWKKELSEDWLSTLCRLLISVQRYRHGGALLITRTSRDLDIKYKIDYRRLPQALASLAAQKIAQMSVRDCLNMKYLEDRKKFIPRALYLDEAITASYIDDYENEITGCVRFISSMSCVDGLILASPDLSIRGFGVEIRTRKEVEAVYLSLGPALSDKRLRRIDSSHYGTRHRTMMRFCFAHPESIGFVISQDGEIRAMARVKDRLVMWENLKVLHYWDFQPKKPP